MVHGGGGFEREEDGQGGVVALLVLGLAPLLVSGYHVSPHPHHVSPHPPVRQAGQACLLQLSS